MSKEDVIYRDIYRQTSLCIGHKLVPSRPFRVYKGEFIAYTCPICFLSRIEIDGVIYEDSILKILNWLSHISIEQERKDKKEFEEVINSL